MGSIIRFGNAQEVHGIPTEIDFRKSVGTSGFKKHFIRSSKYLHAIYTALRAARSRPNDFAAMRKLRKACSTWLSKKGKGVFSGDRTGVELAIEQLGQAADRRYCDLVNRFYYDRGRQAKLDRKKLGSQIRDKVHMSIDPSTGQPRASAEGLTLSSEYAMERHSENHTSPHAASERQWQDYKRTYPRARLGFEDWVDQIKLPALEDDVAVLYGKFGSGSVGQIKEGVKYLSEGEREQFRIIVSGQRLASAVQRQTANGVQLPPEYLHTARMNDTRRGFGIFVIDFERNLFIGNPVSAKFHHSSFMSGSPVYSAGEIAVDRGRVIAVTNKTGHYRAGADALYRSLCVLRTMGVGLHNAVVSDRSGKDNKWRSAMVAIRYRCDFESLGLKNSVRYNEPVFS